MNQDREFGGADRDEVDLDLLAEYAGGALAGTPQAATVERLISGDSGWARAYDELLVATEAVRADLGTLAAIDAPMPAEVAARLDAALALASPPAAGAARPVGSVAAATGAGGPPLHLVPDDLSGAAPGADRVVAPLDAARRRRRPRWATPVGVAAGVLAIAGVGATIAQSGSDHSDAGTAATSSRGNADRADGGSGLSNQQAAPQSPLLDAGTVLPAQVLATGTDYRRDTVAALSTNPSAAVLPPGPAASQGSGGNLKPGSSNSGESQSDGSLPDSAGLARLRGLASSAAVPPELRRLTAAAALRTCLDAIAEARTPLATSVTAVDFARFEGAPALMVALTGGSTGGQVWVVSAQCGLAGPGTRFVAEAG